MVEFVGVQPPQTSVRGVFELMLAMVICNAVSGSDAWAQQNVMHTTDGCQIYLFVAGSAVDTGMTLIGTKHKCMTSNVIFGNAVQGYLHSSLI